MTAVNRENAPARPGAATAILAAGAAAGVLDILAAIARSTLQGNGALVVLKAVASGLLGRDAFRGGSGIAALGLLLHFIIATGWAALYYALSRRFPVLVERPVVSGALYGVAVYWLMRLVVVPLSAAPFGGGGSTAGMLVAIAIHIACVGLPIALLVARFRSPAP
jgi:hypothetical protein